MSYVLISYSVQTPQGASSYDYRQQRYVLATLSAPFTGNLPTPAMEEVCKTDALLHGEQFRQLQDSADCPIKMDKAVAVSFRLIYDVAGDIKLRKLTVSRSTRALIGAKYYFRNTGEVDVAYKFFRRDAHWLPRWNGIMYPSVSHIPVNPDHIVVTEIKRSKYGLTTVVVKLVYNAEGIDKSQYRLKAQELVQKELDKLSIELHTGHSLLQCTQGFSEIKG